MRVLPVRLLLNVGKETIEEFGRDQVGDLAAALTYYAIFSLFPLLLLMVTVAQVFFDPNEARSAILDFASRFAPGQTAQVLSDTVKGALESRGSSTLLVTVIGIIGLLFSASGVFNTLDKAINRAWGCEYKRGLVSEKLFSFAMMLGLAVVMILSLTTSAVLTFIRTTSNALLQAMLGDALNLAPLWQLVTVLVPISLNTAILIFLFRLLPRDAVRVREVWLGALLTALGWEILKQAFAFYLANFAHNANVYGTLGAFFSLITWIYLSSVLLLSGAEFTSAYARALRHYEGLTIPAGGKAAAARPPLGASPAARAWRGAGDAPPALPPAAPVAEGTQPAAADEYAAPHASAGVLGAAALASLGLGLLVNGIRLLTRSNGRGPDRLG